MNEMMDDHNTLETTEHLTVTQTVATATLPPKPTKTYGRKNRSAVWNHFTPKPGTVKKAKCNYCGCLLKYADGTSSISSHAIRCKANPGTNANKRRKTTLPNIDAATSSPRIFKFDQEAARKALVEMFVLEELPFSFVESKGFPKFLSIVQGRFKIPSRTTLACDILALYAEEKVKLQRFLSTNCGSVCLINDTWTSCQNMRYMSLTAHFIDNDWKLHKKILNFCQVSSHSGEIMAKTVKLFLNHWEWNQVFCLTVDNPSSNDVGI